MFRKYNFHNYISIYISVFLCAFSTERMLQTDPDYLEKWEKEQEKKGLTQSNKSKFSFFGRKKKDSTS